MMLSFSLLFVLISSVQCSLPPDWPNPHLRYINVRFSAHPPPLTLNKNQTLLKEKNGTVEYEIIGSGITADVKKVHFITVSLSIPSMVDGEVYRSIEFEDSLGGGRQLQVIGNKQKKIVFTFPYGAVLFRYTSDAPEFTATFNERLIDLECHCPVMFEQGNTQDNGWMPTHYSFNTTITKECGNFVCGWTLMNEHSPTTVSAAGKLQPGDKMYLVAADNTIYEFNFNSAKSEFSFPGNIGISAYFVPGETACGNRDLMLKYTVDPKLRFQQ